MKKIFKTLGALAIFGGLTATTFAIASSNLDVSNNKYIDTSTENVKLSNSGIMTLSDTTYTDEELRAYVRQYQNSSTYNHSNIANTINDDEYEGYYDSYKELYNYSRDYNVFTMFEKAFINTDIYAEPTLKYGNDDIESVDINFKKGYHYLFCAEDYSSLLDEIYNYDCDVYLFNECLFNDESGMNGYLYETFVCKAYSLIDGYDIAIVIPNENFTATTEVFIGEYLYEFKSDDFIAPDFTNESYYIPVNVDNMLTIDEIKSNIVASDETDGDISNKIIVESTTYDFSNKTIGNYPFNVSVTDNAGNKSTATFYVSVVDLTAPTITGTDKYTYSYDDEEHLTVDSIKQSLLITDNYDTDLTFNDIVVLVDGYTGNESKVGTYEIAFNVLDSSDNASETFVVNVSVIDTKAPVITCPNTISCGTASAITTLQLKSKIVVEDGYDGKLTNYTITDLNDYENNYANNGNYQFMITAKDSSGNTSTYTFTLEVSDSIAPTIMIARDFVIALPVGAELTKDMIINHLVSLGEIELSQVADCSYEVNTNQRGIYNCSIALIDGSTYETKIVVANYDVNGNSVVSYDYPFKEIFTKEFWQFYLEDWKNTEMWSWVHYTTIGIGAILLLGIIGMIVGKKKK